MPRELDLTRLRFYVSLAFIAIGVGMLIYVVARRLDSDAPTPPNLPVETLVKSRPEDCPPPDWRFIDNTEQRFTICLPLNLVFYDGAGILPLEQASDEDWSRIFREFVFVNDNGLALSSTDTDYAALAPISLRVDVVGPAVSFTGCDLRSQQPDPDGVVRCTDTFFIEEAQFVFAAEAPIHRFKALVPTLQGRSVNEVFSLHLSIVSLSEDWQLQEPLFRQLLATLKPY